MKIKIRHNWQGTMSSSDGTDDPYCFLLASLDEIGMLVRVPLNVAETLAPEVQFPDCGALMQPVMLLLLDRLSHMAEDGLAPPIYLINSKPTYLITFGPDDVATSRRLTERKKCRFQRDEVDGLSCLIGSLGPLQGSLGVATTTYLCGSCPLPDRRLVCRHLRHPRVYFKPGSPTGPEMLPALCDIGQGHVSLSAGVANCKPGGHDCWEQEVELERPSIGTQHALAIHELLEFVDSRWKSAFQQHLLDSHRCLALGNLATSCTSRSDLESKLSALAQVMKDFKIGDELLLKKHTDDTNYGKDRKFARMESALERALGEDDPGFADAKKAIQVLRDVNSLRNTEAHGLADFVTRYAAIGLRYPPPSPSETWAHIQGKVSKALHDLAAAIPDR